MSTTIQTPLARHARMPSGRAAAVLLLLIGVPFFAAGVNEATKNLGSGLGLIGVSMLFNLPAILIVRKFLRVRREAEELSIFEDRVERKTAVGTEQLSFRDLERLEGKITTFQNSGNQYHAYRLVFRGREPLLLETDTHAGVNGDTGRLLQRLAPCGMQPWQ